MASMIVYRPFVSAPVAPKRYISPMMPILRPSVGCRIVTGFGFINRVSSFVNTGTSPSFKSHGFLRLVQANGPVVTVLNRPVVATDRTFEGSKHHGLYHDGRFHHDPLDAFRTRGCSERSTVREIAMIAGNQVDGVTVDIFRLGGFVNLLW